MTTLIIFGTLFLYFFLEIFRYHRKTLDWHGENSMLKVSRTYCAKFFSPYDIVQFGIVFISIVGLIISFGIDIDMKTDILMFVLSTILLCLPTFYFHLKYQYWVQNGNRNYTFDPILRKIIIEDTTTDEICFNEINKVIFYSPKNYKFCSGGYLKVTLKNSEKSIYLTSLLPCYDMLEEFFKGVKKQNIHKRIFRVN